MICRIATSEEAEDISHARAQMYATRRPAGMKSSDSEFRDVCDSFDNTRSYWLKDHNNTRLGTIRVSVFSSAFHWHPIPASYYFGALIQSFQDTGACVIQSSMLGVFPEFRNQGLQITLSLVRAALAVGKAHSAIHLVSMVDQKASTLRFWSRFGLLPWGDPADHPIALRKAVLLRGTIEGMLMAAEQNDAFKAMIDFQKAESFDAGFPVTA